MSQKTFPDSTDNRPLSITGTDPFMFVIEHLNAEAALIWLFTGKAKLDRSRFLVDSLALNLQFSETLFSFHSLIIMRVENPATVKSTLF